LNPLDEALEIIALLLLDGDSTRTLQRARAFLERWGKR